MNTISPIARLSLAVGSLLLVVIGCGGGKPVPEQYQGNWEASWSGQVHSTIYLHADGKAGFKIPGKEVDGGGAEIDEANKTLTISLIGISHTWKIVEPPNAEGEMVLSDTTDLGPMGKAEGKTVFKRR